MTRPHTPVADVVFYLALLLLAAIILLGSIGCAAVTCLSNSAVCN